MSQCKIDSLLRTEICNPVPGKNAMHLCMEYYRSVSENSDFIHGSFVPAEGGTVTDPCLGKGKYDNMVLRGGSYKEDNGYFSMCRGLENLVVPVTVIWILKPMKVYDL